MGGITSTPDYNTLLNKPSTFPSDWSTLASKPSLVNTFNGASGAVNGVSSFVGQTGAVDPTAYGAIGSVFIGAANNSGTVVQTAGATVAGSILTRQNTSNAWMINVGSPATEYTGAGLSGTWRNMGGRIATGTEANGSSSYYSNAIWMRVA